jgi:hypothetical protein
MFGQRASAAGLWPLSTLHDFKLRGTNALLKMALMMKESRINAPEMRPRDWLSMKAYPFALFIACATFGAQAGGHYYSSGHHGGHGPSISFYYGGYYPSYWAPYGYGYWASPTYASYPAYAYDDGYSRPNYAVTGTLLGALTGGLIGNSIHHQGWEGAGIGAAAGMLLGGLAEHDARTYERSSYQAGPPTYYSAPARTSQIPAVNDAPSVADAPRVSVSPTESTYRTRASAGTMGSANSLFGR